MTITGTDGWIESPRARARRLQKDADNVARLDACIAAAAEGTRLSRARIQAARLALKRLSTWGI